MRRWADILPADEEWRGATSTITITYQYDPLYRLTEATYSGGAEYEYTYDAVGNRQTMDSPEGEVSYTYDAANRLTSVAGVTYTWDDNGNLTSDGVRSYTYDHANRLTQVTQGSQTTQFAYNGDGDRTSKTVSGETTQYVLDLATTLPVVVSDTEAVYLYGLHIIAQQQAGRQYYFHDGLGSVRQLLDSTGEVQTNYAYDPFGVPVVEGDATNPYRFTGEAWDEEVELLYLRARYYQPEVGRFIARDPWAGNLWQPSTFNRYGYVSNNPVNYIDLGGLEGGAPGGGPVEHDEEGRPESYQYDIPDVSITWPTEPEPDIPPFEEWVKEWPDPWFDKAVGWEFSDIGFDPLAFKSELFAQARDLYAKRAPKYPIDALAKRNNPLTRENLDRCIGSGLYQRTRANWMKPQWAYFLRQLGMDATQETNYEPYWLTFNMLLHHKALEKAQ